MFATPGTQRIHTGIGFVSVGNRMACTAFSDEKMLYNPQEFVDIVYKKHREILGLNEDGEAL